MAITLVELIQASSSMEDIEKLHWIEILPTLSEENKGRLRFILETEKAKLLELDAKFSKAHLLIENEEIQSVLELIHSI